MGSQTGGETPSLQPGERLAILGAGNIGSSIARGLVQSGTFTPDRIILTRRHLQSLDPMKEEGFAVGNNAEAVKNASIILIAVEPQQTDSLLTEIKGLLRTDRHILISVISGVSTTQMSAHVGRDIPIVRAMPNTAIVNRESMTCLSAQPQHAHAIETATTIFDAVGKTLVINEEEMTAATALCACGVAFFLRAIRAASQGGIEIGFHSEDALLIAAQTAKGATSLLLSSMNHPEHEIDRVTTPRGCTISGLNQMEHEGFSSAMIKGIVTSANVASRLYKNPDD